METEQIDPLTTPRDLGDGLILRTASAADAETLSTFDAQIFADHDAGEPANWARQWTLDMIGGTHPNVGPADLLIVEDTRAARIASAIHFISQTWTYDGIPFGVGRPELVGTHPDYRRRGLVRTLFHYFHARSVARGESMQAISGIPWYYRQFGYEPAVPLEGGRAVTLTDIAPRKESESVSYTVRIATEADLPFLERVEAMHTARHRFACVRDDADWRYALTGMRQRSGPHRHFRIIESAVGIPVGYIAHVPDVYKNGAMFVTRFALLPGVSWVAVVPDVLRALRTIAEQIGEQVGQPATSLRFELGAEHPAFTVAPRHFPIVEPPYAWYIRIADLPGFLRHVTPALERHLAASDVAGHTGELRLSFYRTGIHLTLAEGRVTQIAAYTPQPDERESAGFPDLTFHQLVCGYRSVEELTYAFADAWVRSDEARAVLNGLFPKQFSEVWPIA